MKYLLSLFLVLGLLSCDPKTNKKEDTTPAAPEVEVEVEVQETVTEEVTDSNSVKLEEVGTVSSTEEDIEE
tara:strand:- start:405 stop:617 length:213 start_codon:yes stop_codon:yes gene_type:complete